MTVATWKVNYARQGGKLATRMVQAPTRQAAARMVPGVVLGVYRVNSVGAILG